MPYDLKGKKKTDSEYKKSEKTPKRKTDRKISYERSNERALNTFYKKNGSRSRSNGKFNNSVDGDL